MFFRLIGRAISAALVHTIKLYQVTISPLFSAQCRFSPSCSHYAIEAIKTKPLVIGLWLSSLRIIKCNPLNRGGYDPVK